MPKKLERELKQRAVEHGYAPGSDRYNAYVYGTLNKVIGEWGVDRFLKRLKLMPKGLTEYKPSFGFVHVPMIAIVFSILILLWYFVFRKSPIFGRFQGNTTINGTVPPGSSDDNYLDYSGWYAAQYNANGAEAGYKTGLPQVYVPYNESLSY